MTVNEQLLALLDDSWQHPWESVQSALRGVDETMASWQPPGYTGVEDDLIPPPGTILWHVAHLEHCLRHYTRVLGNLPIAGEIVTPPPADATFAELTAALEAAHRQLRAFIATLPESTLIDGRVRSTPVDQFIRCIALHNTWHGGQMAVVRRMAGAPLNDERS